jgi:6-pyruvoyltetrahydropterin/6-carboxytetrahydropterin synthase
MTIYLTRRETFCAAHRLHSQELSDEENRNIFGKCNYDNGHGHNYVIEVTVRGRINPQTGMLINLVELKEIILRRICDVVDHRNLNLDIPEFMHLNPTAENMAVVFWKWLAEELSQDLLYEIKLYETGNNWVVYKGE